MKTESEKLLIRALAAFAISFALGMVFMHFLDNVI